MRYYRAHDNYQYAEGWGEDCTAELKGWFIKVFALGLLGGLVLGAGIMLLVVR